MRPYLVVAVLFVVLIGASSCPQQTPISTGTPGVQTVTVTVTLTNTTLTASQTTFRSAERYHFIVTNRGPLPREFWIMPQGMAQMMSRMPMAQWRKHLLFATPEIRHGMRSVFDCTFTMRMAQQRLAFGSYSGTGPSVLEMPIRIEP